MSELLTIQEAADRLRLGKRTVERFVATGELLTVKMGRRRMVPVESIDRFLRLAEKRGRVA